MDGEQYSPGYLQCCAGRCEVFNPLDGGAPHFDVCAWYEWSRYYFFQRGCGVELVLYVDSDFASNAADRRSVSGALVMCAGACVAYLTQTQGTVAFSSSEAEYQAMADGMKECIFVRALWRFAFREHVGSTTVYEDDMGALRLAKKPRTTPNSKHIESRHHFIRQRVARDEFKIEHVPSHLQHADFLTKALPRETLYVNRNFAMNIS